MAEFGTDDDKPFPQRYYDRFEDDPFMTYDVDVNYLGYNLCWHKGETFIDGTKFDGNFVDAMKHIGTLPKTKAPESNERAVDRLVKAFKDLWSDIDRIKEGRKK